MKQHPAAPARQGLGDILMFLGHWLRAPGRMGAMAPSSRVLARTMARQIPPSAHHDQAPVIELGGGTGSITSGLLEAGIAPQRLIVIERDQGLASHLRGRFPGVHVVCEDAAALRSIMFRKGFPNAAAVVSGLPFLLFPEAARRSIVEACFSVLGPDKPLIQFTYGSSSPLPHEEYGLIARRAARVWRNLPPATVWTYRLAHRHTRPA